MHRLLSLCALLAAAPALAQRAPTAADSALIGRILVAEDRRDSASAALADGAKSGDPRIRTLARRAAARIVDPKFTTRDSFPVPPAPPKYTDPAWRVRFRSLATRKTDCAFLNLALSDSAWPVRLHAADLAGPECVSDSALVRTLRAWASSPPSNAVRKSGGASWQPAAHAIVALARIVPAEAKALLPRFATSPVPWLRTYAARAAGTLADTAQLSRLARDANDNVKEAAIDALAKASGHAADDEFIIALSARGYQAVRAGARALKGSPRGNDVLVAALTAARRLRRDSSETSRDARMAVLERIGEFAGPGNTADVTALATDFDCTVARSAATIASKLAGGPNAVSASCTPLPITLPVDAVALALGKDVRLRVVLADSSGGGTFTVHLRGDVAPIMAARILELARSGYYNGLIWHRVEPDFVLQGGGRGANEYVGNPRFMRDELGTVPHVRGTVGMSTRGHDTGDGQWFVNLRDNQRLNPDYTVFAEVVDGIETADGVLEGDVIARIEVVPRR